MVKKLGGLHKFMNWDKPILTDSGGFQVFSLAGLRRIKEEGVYFNSHIDGHKIFMGPEESMRIQSNLASTIAMAFDECPSSVADREYIEKSVARTTRWLVRCKKEMERLNSLPDTINKHQMLFGINQGGVYEDIRIKHADEISKLDLDGYAVGGLAVGASHEELYRILDAVVPHLPDHKPTYLMGVGTPVNILEAVDRGVDFFDCVYPSRNGRHGHVYTNHGKLNLFNAKFELDDRPIEEGCQCPACRNYSRAYDKAGNYNVLTVAWTGTICSDPAMVYVSVRKNRYSHHMLEETGEFYINLTTEALAFATDYCGVKSGKDLNKFEEMHLTPEMGMLSWAPMIKESPVCIACEVVRIEELGSHDMFIANVKGVYADEAYMDEKGKFDLFKANPIVYSHGLYYGLGRYIGKFGYSVQKNPAKVKKASVHTYYS